MPNLLKICHQVGKNVMVTDAKRRQEIWCQESANITKTAEALMEYAAKDTNRSADVFVTARHLEHIRQVLKGPFINDV